MKQKLFFILLLMLLTTLMFAQERSGLLVGIQYESTSHENPYVYVGGNEANNVKGFSDNTSHVYFPFGYYGFSKNGYSEFSTYALHQLVVGGWNLLGSGNEYVYKTDKTYSGDSYADGYIPVFDNADKIAGKYKTNIDNKALEASFVDMDLLRVVYSGSLRKSIGLPLLLGAQGGIGNFGIHFAQIQEDHEPSDLDKGYYGLVNFNDAVDLYFGVNFGYMTELVNDDLAALLVQYDWYYFIDGTGDEMLLEGNRITVELTYFPFDYRKSILKNLSFKAFLKTSSVPYMNKFEDNIKVDYSFTKLGLGVNYFLF